MTKEEFHKLEAICKRAWKNLSITGKSEKPKYLRKYEESCPACDISMKAADDDTFNCEYCPVTAWRQKAKLLYENGGKGICLESFFGKWLDSKDSRTRKIAAINISNMNWTWLKVYEKI